MKLTQRQELNVIVTLSLVAILLTSGFIFAKNDVAEDAMVFLLNNLNKAALALLLITLANTWVVVRLDFKVAAWLSTASDMAKAIYLGLIYFGISLAVGLILMG